MSRPLWQDLVLVLVKSTATVLTFVVLFMVLTSLISQLWDTENSLDTTGCTVAVLPIEGTILPFSGFADIPLVVTPSTVATFFEDAEQSSSVAAVLVEINSPGGTPVAAHRIAEQIHDSPLPTVGLIGDIGASGGYMVAAATDFLLASPMSDVGSIGVNMSYVEHSQQNDDEGLTYVQLIAGEFKDMGNPNKPLSDEERALLQADLDLVHNEFIDIVADYRQLPRAEVVALADGASMPGRRAADVGLVDALGDRTQAQAALAALLDVPIADITFCEYEPSLLSL